MSTALSEQHSNDRPQGGAPAPDHPLIGYAAHQEALLRTAESLANLGTYVWYPDGVAYWSEHYFDILGLDPNTVTPAAERFLELVIEEDRGRTDAAIEKLRAGKPYVPGKELRIRRPDGQIRTVANRSVAMRRPDGTAYCIYGIVLDVTDAARSREELARALDELARAQRIAKTGSWRWEPHDRIHWSDQLYEILGYERDVVPSIEAWAARLHPDDFDRMDPSGARRFTGKTPAPVEFRIVRPDGEERWVFMQSEGTFEEDGSVRAMRGIVLDITERRRLEQRLQQSLKMEAIGRLAGGVAHDFNNLLTVILTSVERVRRYGDLSGLDYIESAAQSAADLTRQLLAFSRRSVLKPRVVDLNETIRAGLHLLCSLIGEDVEVIFQPSEGPLRVLLDEVQLQQVLMNLSVNARDAMPRGGRLEISTFHEPSSEPDVGQPHAVIVVKDDGIGMTEEVKARIFDPFFTTKQPGEGTGLGLSTVFGIVSQSSGTISVDSTPGAGTAFRIALPAVEEPAEREHEATEHFAPRSACVLVVEDNVDVRRPLELLLKEAGHVVLSAGSAEEAWTQWKANSARIDLLATDVVMPKLSGPELSARMRAERPELPVLFLTGYSPQQVPSADERTELLTKPFRSTDVLLAIERLVGTSSRQAPRRLTSRPLAPLPETTHR